MEPDEEIEITPVLYSAARIDLANNTTKSTYIPEAETGDVSLVNTGPLLPEEKQHFQALMKNHGNLFVSEPKNLPGLREGEYRINLVEKALPVKAYPKRFFPHDKSEIKK
ncbi:hypothetical protein BB560_005302 [Smittium megazygosporum]|uniref:Uncharacterized protein n=1 Tax=Smittium megazygosporum TaxID=133381 RepID=A0A2T9Z700_9FUNG|nr:hypothetical protein BB560_005302 [Smittium megazygosporum]